MTDHMMDARALADSLDQIRGASYGGYTKMMLPLDVQECLRVAAARLRTLSERHSDVFGYWIPNARACSDGTYADGPGELILADVASDSVKAHGTPMYAHPALSEQQGEAVAFGDDSVFDRAVREYELEAIRHGKDSDNAIAVDAAAKRLYDLYNGRPQPAAGDAVRALPDKWRWEADNEDGLTAGYRKALRDVGAELEAAMSAAPAAARLHFDDADALVAHLTGLWCDDGGPGVTWEPARVAAEAVRAWQSDSAPAPVVPEREALRKLVKAGENMRNSVVESRGLRYMDAHDVALREASELLNAPQAEGNGHVG